MAGDGWKDLVSAGWISGDFPWFERGFSAGMAVMGKKLLTRELSWSDSGARILNPHMYGTFFWADMIALIISNPLEVEGFPHWTMKAFMKAFSVLPVRSSMKKH